MRSIPGFRKSIKTKVTNSSDEKQKKNSENVEKKNESLTIDRNILFKAFARIV